MALQKASEAAILDSLTSLFREHGYDGTSLSRIMKATGLVKASLYHRFAGGKEEMATTVIDRVAGEFATNLLAVLNGPGDPQERLQETGRRLWEFYGAGRKACLLDSLTLNRESPAVQARAKAALDFWIAAFARFARESGGMAPDHAARAAQDAIAAIEGGLVISRVSGNTGPFLRAIDSLPARLLRPAESKEKKR